ncbi:Uncharacterised protein [Mycobacterium tuberculosis]|uniref:Uncharacterized protein n=1 Tax=Mycobacterium tuberculosis TaxID=1773 RepID=A0A0U0QI37_MYCTX|nr:predicted protein [Mycobacterium tuberculosis T17]CFE51897.1 Uncharacterised protein [Mycobacterium tuberculosis]CFR77151.1 Uncharacterised protein [Mycobacterium tuberculosis]CFR82802.1 Uncharacterised protein [Mycobacterium tuberculosis]CFR96819.1 Uncharacterised protein [Mycobacterium tuberculosis]
MPAAVTATTTPSGPGSAGSGWVLTLTLPAPSMTTARMLAYSLSLWQNELRPMRFAYLPGTGLGRLNVVNGGPAIPRLGIA